MIRMSMLKNYPIVFQNQQLGILHNTVLDTSQKKIEAIIVSCGLRGKRVILQEAVQSIANGFMLVNGYMKYKQSYEKPSCVFLNDSSGLLVGRITDYLIDEQTLRIIAIEMIRGYLPHENRNRIWIYEYHRPSPYSDEIIIPACFCSELIHSSGGK